MHPLNHNHLYYFQTIAKHGSIKRAAQVLHLTQQTLSDQLRSLEVSLGAKLFERKHRRLELNNTGKETLRYTNKIFSIDKLIQSNLTTNITSKSRHPIRIGIVPHLSKAFILDYFKPALSSNRYRLKIHENETEHLLQDLIFENLDLAITNSRHLISPWALKSYKIAQSRFFAVASEKFALENIPFPECLAGKPFFHYTDKSPFKGDIDAFFERNKIVPNIVCEVDDIYLLKLSLASDEYFAILPETSITHLKKTGNYNVIGEIPELKTDILAVTTGAKIHPKTQRFIEENIVKAENMQRVDCPTIVNDVSRLQDHAIRPLQAT